MKYLLLFIPFLSFGQYEQYGKITGPADLPNLQTTAEIRPWMWGLQESSSKTRAIQHQTDLTKYCDCANTCDPHVIHNGDYCVSIDDCLHNWVETDNRRGMYSGSMISCAVYHGLCGCPDKWKDIKKICKNCGLHFREWETCEVIPVEKEDTYDDVLKRFEPKDDQNLGSPDKEFQIRSSGDVTIEAGEGVNIEREGDIITITVDEWGVDTMSITDWFFDTAQVIRQDFPTVGYDLQECILLMMDVDEPYIWWQRGYVQFYLNKESEFYDLEKNLIDPSLIFDFKLD